ncbi:MAG: TIGR03663 family protein [Dehalococcoidia bacterium]|nr:TIGR03663 family protein [Dehalococcoidia bacterium]MCB9484076.1 TIGR03663 family protein [Dehalococcoidia bacterium]MCB9490535.1 TIGR03663 family protein [Dehalococcoidia bacterium]
MSLAVSTAARSRSRLRFDVRSWDRVTWMVIGITAIALATRVIGLGARALHHDESLHLMYGWYFFEGRGYEHNPLMHGPLQFHLIAAFFKLFGDSEFTGRLPHALAGTALVASPLLFRRWLNGPSIVLASVFLLLSPSIMYYSRFARNEPFVGLFLVVMVGAMLHYRRDGRPRWLVIYSAMLALQFAAKETAYLIAAILLLYQNAWLAHDLFWQPRRERLEGATLFQQARGSLVLTPVAWLIAVGWPFLGRLRSRYGWYRRPRSADMLVVTATLVLPLLSAAVEIPVMVLGHDVDDAMRRDLATIVVPITLVVAAAVGAAWQPRWWIWCVAAYLLVLVPLYTTWGTHPTGIAGAFWTSLDYWIDQQEVRRGTQPWFYYFWLVPLYESLVLIPGLIGGLWLTVVRRDWFAALGVFWFLSMFAALSYAGEKMPWLTFHLALPLCFLAAYVIGRVVPRAAAAVRRGRGSTLQWASASAATTFLLLLGVLAVRVDWNLNRVNPDTPVEPLIYVQTSPRLLPIADDIRAALREGTANRVVIHTDQSLTWPWAWYLRGLNVTYIDKDQINTETLKPDDIVITTRGFVSGRPDVRNMYQAPVQYPHRWWFPEAGYRATTLSGLFDELKSGELIDEWTNFLVHRGDVERIGSLQAEVYFPKNATVNSRDTGFSD